MSPKSRRSGRRWLRCSTARRSSRTPTTARSSRCTPSCPPGFAGQVDAFQEVYGEASADEAQRILDDAGVNTPVDVTVGYTPTHYGPNAVDEATEVERQLEESGLFNVTLESAEWEQYQTISKEGAYDIWQLGWFPDFPDADTYLSPFMVDGGFFENGYSNEEVNSLMAEQQGSPDQAARQDIFGQLQQIAAEEVPFVPSWVGPNLAVYGEGIQGVEDTFDPSFIFRFWLVDEERLVRSGHAVVGRNRVGFSPRPVLTAEVMSTSSSGSLPRYIVQRTLLVIPMIWVILTLVFFMLRVAPGDPVCQLRLGGRIDEEASRRAT